MMYPGIVIFTGDFQTIYFFRDLTRPFTSLGQCQPEAGEQNLAQVSEVLRGELSNFKDAHGALQTEISQSVAEKVKEFSEQVNQNLQRVEASLDTMVNKGDGAKAEGRKARADRG